MLYKDKIKKIRDSLVCSLDDSFFSFSFIISSRGLMQRLRCNVGERRGSDRI